MLKIQNKSIIYLIPISEILFCKTEGNYTSFILNGNKRIVAYITLKKTLKNLPAKYFCRCHNSFIINLKQINVLNLKKNIAILKDNSIVPISLRKKKDILNALNEVEGF